MDRKTSTLVLAGLLILFVMVISLVLYLSNPPRPVWQLTQVWRRTFSQTEILKGINLIGDKTDEIFLAGPSGVAILDSQGEVRFSATFTDAKATLGDLDGTPPDEFVVVRRGEGASWQADAFRGDGSRLWSRALPGLAEPSRAVSVDLEGDGRREIVIGDQQGELVCLNSDGSIRWRFTLASGSSDADAYIRGLDDLPLGDGRMAVAAATYAGDLVVLDANGSPLWQSSDTAARLRRLRVYDLNGDGRGEIVLGWENGRVEARSATNGEAIWQTRLGQRVQEIRDVELNGNPSDREIVVGGKSGAVVGYDARGANLLSVSVGDKVKRLAGADLDGDGRDEVFVGTDGGWLYIYTAAGERLADMPLEGTVLKLDTGKRLAEGDLLIAAGDTVGLWRVTSQRPPWWYNPLVAGFLASLVIAGLAWVVGGISPPPKLEYSAEEMSVEALQAKRKMLIESLSEMRRLQERGEIPPDAYEARMRELRSHIARTEAELIKLGVEVKREVAQCPNCGAPIEVGADRCPYCGQTLL